MSLVNICLDFKIELDFRLCTASGTEPKIKFYFEVKTDIDKTQSVKEAIDLCESRINDLEADIRNRLNLD